MTIELHTWNTPNGRKISVALEEMGLIVEVHHHGLDLLRRHHRPHSAAGGEPRGPAVLVAEGDARDEPAAATLHGERSNVSEGERQARFGQQPVTLLLTGLTGSGSEEDPRQRTLTAQTSRRKRPG